MRYKVRLLQSDEGFSASVPDLRGCWTQGTTAVEALENIRSVVEEYLAVKAELTRAAPRAKSSELFADSRVGEAETVD